MLSDTLLAASCIAGVVALVVSLSGRGTLLQRVLLPETQASLMLVAIFCVRPLLTRGDMVNFHGRAVSFAGRDFGLMVGAVALSGLTVGILFARHSKGIRGSSRSNQREPSDAAARAGWTVRWAAAGIAAYLGALLLAQGAQGVVNLVGGRSAQFDISLPELFSVLPLTGPIAAGMSIAVAPRERRIPTSLAIAAIVAVLACAATLSLVGTRRFMIPALLIPLICLVYSRSLRLRLWHWCVAIPLGVFMLLLPLTRSAGGRLPNENVIEATVRVFREQGASDTLLSFFTSYDTEMFDYIAYVGPHLGVTIPYGDGRGTFLEFITRPLPVSVSEGYSNQLLGSLFGGNGCGQSACPVASLPGVLLFDFGLLGVALGTILFGWLSASVGKALLSASPGNPRLVLPAVFTSYAIVLVRTNTILASWWLIYTIGITLAILHLGSSRHSTQNLRSGSQEPVR